MADDSFKLPDQEQLEKELSDYLSKKYGYRIKVVSPMMLSQPDEIPHEKKKPTGTENIQFDLKPEELESYLDQYVVKQKEAKAVLATKICTHYNRIRFQRRGRRPKSAEIVGRIKNNVLLIGPTGVGKTYLVKLIARKLGVPFVKGDATKFSETGYVGGDVEDLVRELLIEAGDDLELAEHGIIYLDEVDKIASSRHLIGPDVSRTGVQRALLKPMEETEVDVKVPHDPISQIQAIEHYRKTGKREKRTINTRNILFIMSGAFNDLAPLIKKRLQTQGVGFGAQIHSRENDQQFMRHAKAEDFVEYGFESEFVGRLPVMAVLEPLEVEDLYDILKNPNNPIILGKMEDFRSYGIDIKFEDEALRLLAEMAYAEKTGARGLVSVIERVLLPYEKSLPTSTIRFVLVTRAVVLEPMGELRQILEHPHDPERLQAYMKVIETEKECAREKVMQGAGRYLASYPQVFPPERIELVVDQYLRLRLPVESIMEEMVMLYNQIREFENDFHKNHRFTLRFDEEAVDQIIEEALQRDSSASAICLGISRDFDYGFKLIYDRCGQTDFIMPRKAVLQPSIYLDELIRENYRNYPLDTHEQRETS